MRRFAVGADEPRIRDGRAVAESRGRGPMQRTGFEACLLVQSVCVDMSRLAYLDGAVSEGAIKKERRAPASCKAGRPFPDQASLDHPSFHACETHNGPILKSCIINLPVQCHAPLSSLQLAARGRQHFFSGAVCKQQTSPRPCSRSAGRPIASSLMLRGIAQIHPSMPLSPHHRPSISKSISHHLGQNHSQRHSPVVTARIKRVSDVKNSVDCIANVGDSRKRREKQWERKQRNPTSDRTDSSGSLILVV